MKPHTHTYGFRSKTNAEQQMLYGVHPLLEALAAERTIDRVLLRRSLDGDTIQKIVPLLRSRSIPFQYVPVEKLNRITGKNHQGVIAFMSLIEYADLEEILIRTTECGDAPLLLMLDGITDVRNFGAIVRSAECAGVHAIVVPSAGSAPISADAMRTSAGALNYVPVCKCHSLRMAALTLRTYGVMLLAASGHGSAEIYDAKLHLPTALIMGAEDSGVSQDMLKIADATIKIPLAGKIESLNVSAAASVMLFEALRQRRSMAQC
jgi:23S rRNA (guanosine2251-2'-O)-methyltransferase